MLNQSVTDFQDEREIRVNINLYVLQTIYDTFDVTRMHAVVLIKKELRVPYNVASARAESAAAADDAEDDLDSVDADEYAEYEASLEEYGAMPRTEADFINRQIWWALFCNCCFGYS